MGHFLFQRFTLRLDIMAPMSSFAPPPPPAAPVPPKKTNFMIWIALIIAAAAVYALTHGSGHPPDTGRVGLVSGTSSGATAGGQIPDWVPVYPGSKPGPVDSKKGRDESYLNFSYKTNDNCHQVGDFYDKKLNLAGFKNVRFEYDSSGCVSTIRSEGPGHTRSINVRASDEMNGTGVSVEIILRGTANGTPPSTSGAPNIPAWVPVYPGTTPENVTPQQYTGEYHVSFSIKTTGDLNRVLTWYQDKLQAAGLKVTSEIPSPGQTLGGAIWSSDHAAGRSLNVFTSRADPYNVINFEIMDQKLGAGKN